MNEEYVIESIEYLKKYKSETDNLEVKSASGGFPKCYDTLSSFSNKNGGLIIFGINESNDFSVDGVYDINDLQKKISEVCSNSFEPSLRIDMLPMEYEGKEILAVNVHELNQEQKPSYYKPKGLNNGAYIRIGDRDEVMSDYEIYSIKSYNEHIEEDIRPVKRANIDDLDKTQLNQYIDKIKESRPKFANNDFNTCLKKCSIITEVDGNIYPTLAGEFVFGDFPQEFFPQLFIACTVVPGFALGDTSEDNKRFIDNRRIEGNIEEMLDQATKFVERNMKKGLIVNDDGTRVTKYEYPIKAIWEAIANALIHRDYSFYTEGAYISVNMFYDRIEVTSPGGLYGKNKLEKIENDVSLDASRNPAIIRLLEEKSAIIENRHTGIPTMVELMREHGLPDPEFRATGSKFIVTFRNGTKSNKSETQNNISGQPSGQPSGQVSGQPKYSGKLEKYMDLVLEFCVEPRSLSEIKDYLNISSRQYVSSNIIKPLLSSGKLDYLKKDNVHSPNQKYVTVRKD